ncbi:MAG: TolC family protein [Verrucomicrobia bacterium]|nr:TolC family protein [Verrucomicrobiota bacterium]
MRRLLLFALVLLPLGPALAGAETLSKNELLRTALCENQRLKAARARWEMMKQRVPQAKAWEDLMAGVELQRMGTLNPAKVTDVEWMISQALPISGKNLSRARAACAEALAAFQELRRVQLDVVTQVQGAYFRLAGAHGQLEINKRNQELLKQVAEISRKKYEVGTASQSDVLLAETELARLSEGKAMIERDISDQQTRLNVLTNCPARTAVARPEPLSFLSTSLVSQKAESLALQCRPEVLLAWRKIEAEKARLQLARRQWIPDPALQIKAREYPGSPGIREYDTGIVFSVPWLNKKKYCAAEAEAEESLASAQHEYEAARTEAAGMVRDQLKKIETFAANYRLFHDQILPTARMSVESTRAGYETEKSSFLELITARRNLQDIESAGLNQLVEHQVAIAELEAIVGISRYISQSKETSK